LLGCLWASPHFNAIPTSAYSSADLRTHRNRFVLLTPIYAHAHLRLQLSSSYCCEDLDPFSDYHHFNPLDFLYSILGETKHNMGLGVLEDHKLEHVPGTAPLNELGIEGYNATGVDSSSLKHDPTGQIVLVPQPSDSPNDPYNWSRWKKERFTLTYAFGCGAVGGRLFPSRTQFSGFGLMRNSCRSSPGCSIRPACKRIQR
jgi:hypothetical protein